MRVAASFKPIHLFAAVYCLSTLGVANAALVTHTHQYDFEHTTGYLTEPGWTHVDILTAGGPATFGFLPAPGAGKTGIDRGGSTQVPFLVTRDNIYSSTNGNPSPDIIFRDIVPPLVEKVDLVIYRTDSADGFIPNFTTSVSFNGGAPIVIDTGLLVGGTYFAPITASLTVPMSLSSQTMDFFFSDNIDNFAGDSSVRLNGIQAILTEVPIPEPSSLTLLGLGLVGVIRRARRKSR